MRSLQGVDEIDSTVSEGSPADRRPARASARRSIARSTTCATRSRRSAANLPDGILEPQVGRAITSTTTTIASLLGDRHRHDARAAELVRRQYRRQGAAVGPRHGGGRAATAASTARSASSSIRRKMQAQGSPRARSTSSCARSTSTPPAAAPKSRAPNSRCACSATRRTPMRSARRRSRSAAGARSGSPTSPTVRDVLCRAAQPRQDERPPGAQLRHPARQGRVGRHRLSTRRARKLASAREGATPRSSSRAASTASNIPRSNIKPRCEAMIEGAVLAVIVVFLFLRDWRATVISALAIPLSAIPTFWFMELLGFTLNQHDPARAQPGRGRAGRRRDRRDREYRPAHADGQIGLSGVDRRRRRDRPRGAGDHHVDRRGVPAGRR